MCYIMFGAMKIICATVDMFDTQITHTQTPPPPTNPPPTHTTLTM